MTFDQSIVIAAVVVPLALAMAGRLRADVAALLIAVLLGTAQFLGLGILAAPETPTAAVQAFAGFSQPVVITLLSLFVITRALDKSGVTRALARRILRIGGASEVRITLLFLMCAVVFSLFMNNVAVGALLLPSAVDAARRSNMKSSKLLMPLAFGTLLGGMATYFTTANIIIDNLLQSANPPQTALNVLDFTPTGGMIAVMGLLFISTIGRRLLPERTPLTEQMMPYRTGSELEEVYQLGERLWEARVVRHSPHVGRTLAQTRIGERFGVSIIALWHGRQAIFSPTATHQIQSDDVLLMIGRQDRVQKLADEGFIIGRQGRDDHHISEMGVSFIEVTLAPHSRAVGKTLKELQFRKLYNYTAVALWREGVSYRTDVADFTLKPGDSFLVIGPLSSLRRLRTSRDFIALESDLSDQPLDRRPALIAFIVTALAIGVSVLGFPVSLAMMSAAVFIVVFGLLSNEDS
jgi:di/tricarboxylate transporter